MTVVSVRELQRNSAAVLKDLESARRPAFITRRGRPIAVLVPLDEDSLYDYVLAHAPEFVADMRRSDEELARGERGTPLEEVIAELEAEA